MQALKVQESPKDVIGLKFICISEGGPWSEYMFCGSMLIIEKNLPVKKKMEIIERFLEPDDRK